MFDATFGDINYTVEYDSYVKADVTTTTIYFWLRSKLRRVQHVVPGYVEDEQLEVLKQLRSMSEQNLAQF